jgi:hypothetical protein
LPQNEQWSVFFESLPPTLLILAFRQWRMPRRSNLYSTSPTSGTIHGIGPVYAKKLVHAFKERVFDVIESETG